MNCRPRVTFLGAKERGWEGAAKSPGPAGTMWPPDRFLSGADGPSPDGKDVFMAHLRIRIEEMEYRPDSKSLHVLAVDEFAGIVTLEIAGVYPRQLAADLEFVARHPDTRVVVDGPGGGASGADAEGTRRSG